VAHRQENHRFAVSDETLVIFGKPAVVVEPTEGAFDDPALREQHESLHVIRSLHDLQRASAADPLDPEDELSRIPAICPDEQKRAEKFVLLRFLQDELGTVSILDIGSMDNECKDETNRINEDMSLPSGDLLAGIVPMLVPFFSVVFTDWLSMEPAEGSGFLPAFLRTFRRNSSCIRFHVPSSDQIEK